MSSSFRHRSEQLINVRVNALPLMLPLEAVGWSLGFETRSHGAPRTHETFSPRECSAGVPCPRCWAVGQWGPLVAPIAVVAAGTRGVAAIANGSRRDRLEAPPLHDCPPLMLVSFDGCLGRALLHHLVIRFFALFPSACRSFHIEHERVLTTSPSSHPIGTPRTLLFPPLCDVPGLRNTPGSWLQPTTVRNQRRWGLQLGSHFGTLPGQLPSDRRGRSSCRAGGREALTADLKCPGGFPRACDGDCRTHSLELPG